MGIELLLYILSWFMTLDNTFLTKHCGYSEDVPANFMFLYTALNICIALYKWRFWGLLEINCSSAMYFQLFGYFVKLMTLDVTLLSHEYKGEQDWTLESLLSIRYQISSIL